MYDDLYCKVFVDTDMDYEKLFALLISCIDGKKEAVNYVITEWCDISVQKNKEYNVRQYLLDSTDFLYWRYYLEIDPLNIDEKQYIRSVAMLLNNEDFELVKFLIFASFGEACNNSSFINSSNFLHCN